MKKTLFALLVLGAAVSATMGPASRAAAHSAAVPARSWQIFSRPATMPSFLQPHGIAVDARGNLYVADAGHNQIQKISPAGKRLAVFGSFGWRPGHFRDPAAVAVDRWGNIYVADVQNYRVQKLSPSGRVLAVFGLRGWSWVSNMAVDRGGHVYVSYYDRIEKLSARGALLATWRGQWGPLASDGEGNVYVAGASPTYDPADRRYYFTIYRLVPQRRIFARWQSNYTYLSSMAVDAHGYVYVLDQYRSRILKVSPAGELVAKLGGPSHRLFLLPTGVAVDAAGNLYVTDSGNQHLDKLSPQGRLLAAWGTLGSGPGRYRSPGGVAVDRQGNVYVADTWNDRIQKLSPQGMLLRQWGSHGRAPGQFDKPASVLVNRQGNVVVADYSNSRLEMFSPRGKLLGVLHVPGPHFAYGYEPYGWYYPQISMDIAFDPQGNYIIADSANNRVEKLSPRGRILAAYSEWATSRESFVGGVAVDRAGNIYIADSGAPRIVKLSPSGHRLATWGSFGYTRAGDFNRPRGLAVDAHGNIYVTDVGNHCIQKLSPTGRPLAAWGTMGSARGQFAFPQGIIVDGSGAVYVADTWNNRIQRLGA